MEHEHFDPELDDLLSDIRRLIDEDAAAEEPAADEFDLAGLLDEEIFQEPAPQPAEPEPVPEPVRWTEKQKAPKHVAKLQKNQEQAYADWLYAQEQPPAQDPMAVRWTEKQKVPRHVAKLQKNQEQAYADWLYEQEHRAPEPVPEFPEEPERPKKKKRGQAEPAHEPAEPPKKKKRRGFRNFLIFLVGLALLAAVAAVFLLPRQPKAAAGLGERKDGISTILLIGTDAGGARTDTLMLLTMDRPNRQLSLVSIPRDTLVNGTYAVPKINSVYGANNGGSEGIEMLMTRVQQSIGFRPDGYILIRLDAFVDLVDALGGVEFEVPVDMFYNDPSQDLYIALEQGKQLLSGEEAMGLVRFRSGYADADLGRVQVQREFLSALIDQAVSLKGVAKSPRLLQVFLDSTETDLTVGNFLWLAKAAVLSDLDNIETATLPGTPKTFESGAYYVLDPASVAQTVNTYCNPYVRDVTTGDLEIRVS